MAAKVMRGKRAKAAMKKAAAGASGEEVQGDIRRGPDPVRFHGAPSEKGSRDLGRNFESRFIQGGFVGGREPIHRRD